MYQSLKFEDVAPDTWDSWVECLEDATYLHSSRWLGYCHACLKPGDGHSFAVLDSQGSPMAICPLGVSPVFIANESCYEASWNGIPLGTPAIKSALPSQRRRLARTVYELLHEEMNNLDLARSLLKTYPLSARVLRGNGLPIGGVEPLSAGYFAQPENTIIFDLGLPLEELRRGMTREQRKHVQRSEKDGLEIKEFRGASKELEEMHAQYLEAHNESAGGLTRPQYSFDYMLESASRNLATLFVSFSKGTAVSFLYCGEFENAAFGWSQANLDELERQFSLRHLLEWSAILAYKRRGFKYYEIGARWYGPQLYKIPHAKELSISAFKERFGGQLWPTMQFEKFFDRELFRIEHERRLKEFLDSGYFALAGVSNLETPGRV